MPLLLLYFIFSAAPLFAMLAAYAMQHTGMEHVRQAGC